MYTCQEVLENKFFMKKRLLYWQQMRAFWLCVMNQKEIYSPL